MDYMTKPVSRQTLRHYAELLRELFGVKQGGPFPVLEVLDKIPDVFQHCNWQVLKDKAFKKKTMAYCTNNSVGGYTINIKESVYNGAYEHQTGAYLDFICHELCHIFLLVIGYTPLLERGFDEGQIERCCSVEWQAKALCGEVMIPYKESQGMGWAEICERYHVSKAQAYYRCKLKK